MIKKLSKKKLQIIKHFDNMDSEELLEELIHWTIRSHCIDRNKYHLNDYIQEMCRYLLGRKLYIKYNPDIYTYNVESDYIQYITTLKEPLTITANSGSITQLTYVNKIK